MPTTMLPVTPVIRVYKDLPPTRQSRLTVSATISNTAAPGGAITLAVAPVTGLTVPANITEGVPFNVSIDPTTYVPAKRITWHRGKRVHPVTATPGAGAILNFEIHVMLLPGGPPG